MYVIDLINKKHKTKSLFIQDEIKALSIQFMQELGSTEQGLILI